MIGARNLPAERPSIRPWVQHIFRCPLLCVAKKTDKNSNDLIGEFYTKGKELAEIGEQELNATYSSSIIDQKVLGLLYS